MLRIIFAAFLLFFATTAATAQSLTGRVVSVLDGDTIDMLTAQRKTVRVRLAEIDAPEHGQPYGDESKKALSQMVFGKPVTARVQTTDKYGRSVARVFQGSTDISAVLVRRGAAWRFARYSTDGRFVEYEAEAKALRKGLWALQPDQQIAPWDWRAAHGHGPREQTRVPTSQPRLVVSNDEPGRAPRRSATSCSPRRYCNQMSCAEAYAYLTACGPEGIDGDHDGKPCERQCGY